MRFSALLLLAALPAYAQNKDANYDEAKVPKYTLPDPLILQNGQPVKNAKTWNEKRRPELLNLRTFPTLMGYSSRIMAESWESNLLYYAALADELHVMPSQLNVLVPEWTQATVEKIFATHLEDWPALLRSLRLVGDDVRVKMRKQMSEQKASLQ